MYKYRFHYLLRQLSHEDYEIAMKWIPETLGISSATWKRWIYLKSDSHYEISEFHLSGLASFFQCEIKDLKNTVKAWNLWNHFQDFKAIQRIKQKKY